MPIVTKIAERFDVAKQKETYERLLATKPALLGIDKKWTEFVLLLRGSTEMVLSNFAQSPGVAVTLGFDSGNAFEQWLLNASKHTDIYFVMSVADVYGSKFFIDFVEFWEFYKPSPTGLDTKSYISSPAVKLPDYDFRGISKGRPEEGFDANYLGSTEQFANTAQKMGIYENWKSHKTIPGFDITR